MRASKDEGEKEKKRKVTELQFKSTLYSSGERERGRETIDSRCNISHLDGEGKVAQKWWEREREGCHEKVTALSEVDTCSWKGYLFAHHLSLFKYSSGKLEGKRRREEKVQSSYILLHCAHLYRMKREEKSINRAECSCRTCTHMASTSARCLNKLAQNNGPVLLQIRWTTLQRARDEKMPRTQIADHLKRERWLVNGGEKKVNRKLTEQEWRMNRSTDRIFISQDIFHQKL